MTRPPVKPLLCSSLIITALLSSSVAAFSLGYIEALLELHLRTFQLTVTSVGFCFLAFSILFTLTTILAGYFTDFHINPWTTNSSGLVFLSLGFVIVGPAPYLPLPPSLPSTLAGLGLLVISSSYLCHYYVCRDLALLLSWSPPILASWLPPWSCQTTWRMSPHSPLSPASGLHSILWDSSLDLPWLGCSLIRYCNLCYFHL